MSLNLDGTWGIASQMAAIAAATFASEDLTCIATGLLIRRGAVHPFAGVTACFLGIVVGDLGLWGLGRIFGKRVTQWRWFRHRVAPQRIDRLGLWFDKHGWSAVLAARFLPGTRLPIYLAAGALGPAAGRFLIWAVIAGLLWTPLLVLLVARFGDSLVRPLEAFFGSGWIAVGTAALALLLGMRIITLACTAQGRARLKARVSRIWKWEFWPMWIFYVPLIPWIAYLAIRYRGLTVPTAANPGIPHSGVVGESKFDILSRLPKQWVVAGLLIDQGTVEVRVAALERWCREQNITLPFILKPDAGQRGMGVKLIRDWDAARDYLARCSQPVLAQAYHPGPFEAGIFYYRIPGSDRGQILSITDKVFPCVVGDGHSSLEDLIWRHSRYRMQAAKFLARFDGRTDAVPAEGELTRLAIAGNHCQGTMFRDGSHLLTPELEDTVERIAASFDGFFFGRFDVRYASPEALRGGRDFAIVELNGATSESTNLYDPTWSLLKAYRTLFKQWGLLYKIGDANRRLGHPTTPPTTLIREIREFYGGAKSSPLAD